MDERQKRAVLAEIHNELRSPRLFEKTKWNRRKRRKPPRIARSLELPSAVAASRLESANATARQHGVEIKISHVAARSDNLDAVNVTFYWRANGTRQHVGNWYPTTGTLLVCGNKSHAATIFAALNAVLDAMNRGTPKTGLDQGCVGTCRE